MKKILIVFICLTITFVFFSCDENKELSKGYEIGVILDVYGLEDSAFNKGTWQTVEAYAKDNDLSCKYYEFIDDSFQSKKEQIERAIDSGARIIFVQGETFTEAVDICQKKYTNIDFVLLDGNLENRSEKSTSLGNTVCVKFDEEKIGYIVGKSLVRENYINIGFMDESTEDIKSPYCVGFVKGIKEAADNQGSKVDFKCIFSEKEDTETDIKEKAAKMYASGIAVIFTPSEYISEVVSPAAEEADSALINVGFDSERFSVVKNLGSTIEDILDAYYEGRFPGGENLLVEVSDDTIMFADGRINFDQIEEENLMKKM